MGGGGAGLVGSPTAGGGGGGLSASVVAGAVLIAGSAVGSAAEGGDVVESAGAFSAAGAGVCSDGLGAVASDPVFGSSGEAEGEPPRRGGGSSVQPEFCASAGVLRVREQITKPMVRIGVTIPANARVRRPVTRGSAVVSRRFERSSRSRVRWARGNLCSECLTAIRPALTAGSRRLDRPPPLLPTPDAGQNGYGRPPFCNSRACFFAMTGAVIAQTRIESWQEISWFSTSVAPRMRR